MFRQKLYEITGVLPEAAIRLWVRLTGRRVAKSAATWLLGPAGPRGLIGEEFLPLLAKQENLRLDRSSKGGILPNFDILKGPYFNPAGIRAEIRDFYEHTSRYHLEAWSHAGFLSHFFLWLLMTFVSRRMNQLNFPLSSLELAGGMTNEVFELTNPTTGKREYTGWLRRLIGTNRVIYAGLYSTQQLPGYSGPCVKVCFPVPLGSATIFLRPEVQTDGSLKLISSGSHFGGPGAYRLVEVDAGHWKVRYIRTLREFFHIYVDARGTLRTDHRICFLGFVVLRLHYKLMRMNDAAEENACRARKDEAVESPSS